MGDIHAYTKGKTYCEYIKPNGEKCKGIALRQSRYCQHHAKGFTTTQTQSPNDILGINQGNRTPRYGGVGSTVRQRLLSNLASPDILDLRQEIALLQAWLQELMDAPVVNFNKQMQIIDRIERLVTNFQRVKLSAHALAQAENKVRLVISNVVLIIKQVVTDKDMRQEIARRLSELGAQYELEREKETLSASVEYMPNDMHSAINTAQAPGCINQPPVSIKPAQEQPQTAERNPETQG